MKAAGKQQAHTFSELAWSRRQTQCAARSRPNTPTRMALLRCSGGSPAAASPITIAFVAREHEVDQDHT